MKSNKKYPSTIFALAPLAAALASPSAALAQEQTPAPAATSIEEVVVTARRREESLQDVPVAISALGERSLREQRIDNAQDLQGRVPSLVVGSAGQTRNTETVSIRGQGATYGASPGVVSYYAEVPLINDAITNGQGGPGKFFDLSNLQVLKGPQGTLFGRNTTGGALLLTPQRPTNANEGYVQLSAGNYNAIGSEAVGNVSLIDNVLMLRAGIKTERRDGFTEDALTGRDYDNRDYWAARLGVLWQPTENVENYLLGFYSEARDNGTGNVLTAINSDKINLALWDQTSSPMAPNGCDTFNFLTGSANCGQDIVEAQNQRGIRDVILSAQPVDDLTSWGLVNTTSVFLNENLTFKNIVSYQRQRHAYNWDLDGSVVPFDDVAPVGRQSDMGQLTEELQLQGTARNGNLEYVIGAYYEKSKPEGDQTQVAVLLFQPGINDQGLETESYAPYLQMTYDLGDVWADASGLNLTLGLRHTNDKIDAYTTYYGYKEVTIEDSATTWTIGLDYRLPNDALVYGKVSHGYKGSAFSAQAVNPARFTADPEYVTSYEAGYKSDFEVAGKPVRFNVAAYLTDYEDMQRATSDIYQVAGESSPRFGSALFNIGRAEISGIEMDVSVELLEGLQLALAYSYTDAKYEDYDVPVGDPFGQLDCSGAVIPFGGKADLSCTPFQFVAENQANLSLRYHLPVDPAVGDISAALNYAWTDEQYTAPSAIPSTEPGSTLDDYGLVNLSVDWRDIMRSNIDVQLFASNLTDEEYRISNANIYQTLYVQSTIYGEPRMFGLSVRYSWGE